MKIKERQGNNDWEQRKLRVTERADSKEGHIINKGKWWKLTDYMYKYRSRSWKIIEKTLRQKKDPKCYHCLLRYFSRDIVNITVHGFLIANTFIMTKHIFVEKSVKIIPKLKCDMLIYSLLCSYHEMELIKLLSVSGISFHMV